MKKRIKVPRPPHKRSLKYILLDLVIFIFILTIASVLLASLNTARKPAIYLYPTEDMQVQVEVDVNGFMFNDIPDYNGGWDVFATTDGIIDDTYDYLFYEAALWNVEVPEEGWVVAYNDLESWFEETLPELGLNEKETAQFIEYWLEELPEANYYEVRLIGDEFLRENMTLTVTPAPDTVLRLLFHFTPVNTKTNIDPPLIHTFDREGFVVVEWGGILGM
jgi:hypothetical protein